MQPRSFADDPSEGPAGRWALTLDEPQVTEIHNIIIGQPLPVSARRASPAVSCEPASHGALDKRSVKSAVLRPVDATGLK